MKNGGAGKELSLRRSEHGGHTLDAVLMCADFRYLRSLEIK
jgi:hypothetical protein